MRRGPSLALVGSLLTAAAAAPAAAGDEHNHAGSSFDAGPARSAAGAGLHVVFRLDAGAVDERLGKAGRRDTPRAARRFRKALLAYLDARFAVAHDGRACRREAPRAVRHEERDRILVLDVVYTCAGAAPGALVRLESSLFLDGDEPHPLVGTIRGPGRADRYFFTPTERVKTFALPTADVGGFRTATPPPGAFRAPPRPSQPPR
ncbi:MAG TPA: hypothetical protein VM734_15425 [Kofleriaceae bacterium]|nr:hypothetical protein [Kofleriaceae bacterium]